MKVAMKRKVRPNLGAENGTPWQLLQNAMAAVRSISDADLAWARLRTTYKDD
jgi:hypothetical protein